MPASMSLKALGLLTALAVVAVAIWPSPARPGSDPYVVAVKLAAGALVTLGSLCLAYAISGTFLRSGGRGAFKALYWATFASAGAGAVEAASGFIGARVPLATAMAALALAGAGLTLLFYPGGG